MCTDQQHDEKIALLHDISRRLSSSEKKPPIDSTPLISSAQPYVVDYKGRRHLFLWSANALTFQLEDLGTLTVAQNTWVNIGYQEGMRLVPATTPTTVPVFVRATDETIP